MILDDGQLLRLFVEKDDQAAFAQFVQRHGALVFNVCSRILGDQQEAEDATQAVFLTAARKAASLQSRGSAAAWLYQVAWHVSLRSRASLKLRATREREAAAMMTKDAAPSNEDLKSVLDEAMHALPDRLLQPLIVHHLEGHSEEDGARLLGVKLGTFSSRLSRAREMLRERLSAQGYAMSAAAVLQIGQQAMSAQPSAALMSTTVKAACLSKAGEAAAAQVASTHALQLSQGVLKMLAVQKAKAVAALAACVLVALMGGFACYRAFAAAPVSLPPAPILETGDEKPPAPQAAPQFVRVLGSATFQPPGNIQAIAFSPDEKYVAAIGHKFVMVWDIATQQVVAQSPLPGFGYDLRFLKNNALVILPDGGERTNFMVWDWSKDKEPSRLKTPPADEGRGHFRGFLTGRTMTVTSDETTALAPGLSGNGAELVAVDLRTGDSLPSVSGASRASDNVQYKLEAIAVSPDNSLVACVDRACGWKGSAMAAAPDRDSNRITIWDWKTKTKKFEWIKTAQQCVGLQWLPDQKRIFVSALGSWEAMNAVILNAENGRELVKFAGKGSLSSDGKFVTTCNDGRIRRLSVDDGKEVAAFEVGDIKYPRLSVLSANGRYFGMVMGGSFLLVDVTEKKRLAPSDASHRNGPHCMSYAADGRLIAYDGDVSHVYDDHGSRLLTFKSTMYRISTNQMLRDGRMQIASGSQDGRAEIWDTYTGNLLGHLGKSTNAVEGSIISSDDRWAMLCYEYNGQAQFFDLAKGDALGRLQGPQHSFFGPTQSVVQCVWTADGKRAFVADLGARMFDEAEIAKMKLAKPIGLSGAYNPSTGVREFVFKNDKGDVVESIDVLCLNPAQDTVFISGHERSSANQNVQLSKASDGSFLKNIDQPGPNAGFIDNGAVLVGELGSVDVATGKQTVVFPKAGKRYLSPSRTLLAVHDAGEINILDVRTGQSVWQCAADNVRFPARLLQWHPGEWQIAICPADAPTVLQVDLFDNMMPAKGVDLSLDGIRHALQLRDVKERQSAVQAVIDNGAKSVDALQKILQTPPAAGATLSDDEKIERRMAVLSLERIACTKAQLDPVLTFFKEAGPKLDDLSAAFCRDAALRLSAVQRVLQLTARRQKPESLTWPSRGEATGDF